MITKKRVDNKASKAFEYVRIFYPPVNMIMIFILIYNATFIYKLSIRLGNNL
ncbi:hypothetical protein PMEGAS67_53810 [Priestia megaterium]